MYCHIMTLIKYLPLPLISTSSSAISPLFRGVKPKKIIENFESPCKNRLYYRKIQAMMKMRPGARFGMAVPIAGEV